jgi:hypothetical protein
VRGAFDRFWADENGVQAKFFAMWDKWPTASPTTPASSASRSSTSPAGAAPPASTLEADHPQLPFHTAAIARLRDRVGDDLLILFDDTGIEALGLRTPSSTSARTATT